MRESAFVASSIAENEEPRSVTGGEALVQALVALGVDTCFGVTGGAIPSVTAAVVQHGRARLVEPRQETHAAHEAASFHRATGRVPAVIVAGGPGATNVMTGVVAAHADRVPMIVIVGDCSAESKGRLAHVDGLDAAGIERMLSDVSRGVFRVMSAASLAAVAMAAFERATDPQNRGPAVIVVPADVGSARCRPPGTRAPRRSAAVSEFPPSRDVLNALAGRLRTARRPLVYVGAGCRDASTAVLQLIESMQCPFVTTPRAKGILPETHPLSLRNAGISSSMWARAYCAAEPDFTIALGTDLDEASTAGTPPIGPGGTLVHVASDPSAVRNYETAFAFSCGVSAFARTFREAVRAHGGSPVGHALAVATRSAPAFDVPHFDSDSCEPIAPHRVIADLEDAVPADTTFVADTGEHTLFALHYLTSGGLRRFVVDTAFGSKASGIAASIGFALGDPSRTVVCICDDAGMQTAGMEILVAIDQRLPIVFAVFNEGRRGPGARCHDSSAVMPRIDFVQWAQSLGIRGARIERAGDVHRDLLRELTSGGMPAVLDIRRDQSVRIGAGDTLESLRSMPARRGHR